MRSLSRRERRALILGGAAAAIGLVNSVAVHPLRAALAESAAALETATILLQRERVLDKQRGLLLASIEKARTEGQHATASVITAPNAALGAASLSSYIRSAAEDAALDVASLVLASVDTVGDGMSRVRLSMDGQGDAHGILLFLDALAQGDTIVGASNVELAQEISRENAHSLSFRMELVSFLRPVNAAPLSLYLTSSPR